MKQPWRRLSVLAGVGLFFIASPVAANFVLQIDDLTDHIPAPLVSGAPSGNQCSNPNVVCPVVFSLVGVGTESISFYFDDGTGPANLPITTIRRLIEASSPDDPIPNPNGKVSDLLVRELSDTSSIEHVSFYSDPVLFPVFNCNDPLVLCLPDMVEDGGFQNVIVDVDPFTGIPLITYQVRSDVPEPATLLLLGFTLAGLGSIRREKA